MLKTKNRVKNERCHHQSEVLRSSAREPAWLLFVNPTYLAGASLRCLILYPRAEDDSWKVSTYTKRRYSQRTEDCSPRKNQSVASSAWPISLCCLVLGRRFFTITLNYVLSVRHEKHTVNMLHKKGIYGILEYFPPLQFYVYVKKKNKKKINRKTVH